MLAGKHPKADAAYKACKVTSLAPWPDDDDPSDQSELEIEGGPEDQLEIAGLAEARGRTEGIGAHPAPPPLIPPPRTTAVAEDTGTGSDSSVSILVFEDKDATISLV